MTETQRTSTPWYRDRTARAIAFQVLATVLVVGTGWYLVHNTLHNMATRNIATGWGFLARESGFGISESMIPYTPADDYARAFVVGLLNTVKVAFLGIILATILGIVIGVARLSRNWLIAKLALVYVEAIRNVPLLLQLIVWYGFVINLPAPRNALKLGDHIHLSGRGIFFPALQPHAVHVWMELLFVAGAIGTYFLARYAKRRQDATGQTTPVFLPGMGLMIVPALILWALTGMPFDLDLPQLKGFNFAGGNVVTPEFAALLIGLVTYTASFISEVVRSGIQAVPHGQTEAARALGLRPGLTLRLVVFPQALRVMVPPITSQYLNLTKNSSLAVAIGYPDLTSIGNTALNQTGQAVECIAIMMAVYLSFSLAISLFMNWYNKKIALVER